MSEVKLNLVDNEQVLHGTIHGSVSDACVAALSAEPETIAELGSALARYNRPLDDWGPFATFHSSTFSSASSPVDSWRRSSAAPLDAEPWDAGIVVIDLAARIVAVESTYSLPQPEGEVNYHDGLKSTDIRLLYRLPEDWLFVSSVEAYQWSRERRVRERLANAPLDVRQVLYGPPLLDFIINECAHIEFSTPAVDDNSHSGDEASDALGKEISGIHARWLMTPRADLGGDSPRKVILAKRDFIDSDLEMRSLQWSLQDEGPPCLSPDSFAYRFAGFGTHEWVIYYDLVRYLLWSAPTLYNAPALWACHRFNRGDQSLPAGHETLPLQVREALLNQLEQLKTAWLEQPQPDYDGRTPAILIDNERKRLPIALRPRDMIIDDDCPVCQMFGDETSPLGMGVGFWHLDGSHMDDDFAFSSYKTREEWESENLRREEFHKEFESRWQERQERIARGEPLEPDPFFDPAPFPGLEFDDPGFTPSESIDDEKEFPQ